MKDIGKEWRLIVDLIENFIYDEDSPSKLRWKFSRKGRRSNLVAGCLGSDGYWTVGFNGLMLKCHRVIWMIENGTIPDGLEIDHINRVRSDNSFSNLRLVTRSQNGFNKKISKSNTSGFTGVRWSKNEKKWKAQIRVNGKSRHLGYYNSIHDAKAAYDSEFHKVTGAFSGQ